MQRRSILKAGLSVGAGIGLPASPWAASWTGTSIMSATAQAAEPMVEPMAEQDRPLQRFPRMMQEYLVQQVRQSRQRGLAKKEALRTAADAEAYVAQVQRSIARAFGPLPERTPLNAKVTKTIQRDGYRIENVIFESRPNFPVTANLYLPNSSAPAPGVVGSCGHSANGKAAEAYQSFAQGLVRQGYVCLIFDPIGQGERLQYPLDPAKSRYGIGVQEHLHAGNQQFLVGEFFGSWRAWDGIRALDYLLTRPEVDSRHVGITGNSGGGTMSTWLCGLESRWTMAAPACFVTTFLRNAENELPADTEQCPPSVLALDLDHEDFLAAMAPKPVIILAKERDFFDVRGSEEAYQRLKRLYTLLGKPNNIALHVGPTDHGYSIENREAMYRHFNSITRISNAEKEPQLTIEKDETLWCTESGQVAELKPATVFNFTVNRVTECRATRQSKSQTALADRVRRALKLPAEYPASIPEFRILRPLGDRKYPLRHATTYAIETEPNVFAISYMLSTQAHLSRPPRLGKHATVYLAHRSSDAELRTQSWLQELLQEARQQEQAIFSVDVRGIGESLPNTCGENTFDSAYGCDYFYAVHGIMLDRPYAGQRTFDVLRVLDWLAGFGYDQIDLIGNQWSAALATFAAVLSPRIRSIRLYQPLRSYEELAQTEHYEMPLSQLVPDVLEHFDLPECYQYLGGKLKILHPAS